MKFLTQLKKIINTGQSRSIILTGNIYDLFHDGMQWVPLINLLQEKLKLERKPDQKGIVQVVHEVNHPIEVKDKAGLEELGRVWSRFHMDTKDLPSRLLESTENSVYALELLRQITECGRRGKIQNNLLIMIEGADLLLPDSEINRMLMPDRKRISIVHDWFSDPDFVSGHDTVVLFAESRSLVHHRIARLPQVVNVEVPLPDAGERKKFILDYAKNHSLTIDADDVAEQTSGLSIYAMNQLLRSGDFTPENIAQKVEEYMVGQLGEGVVEFKRPKHRMADVIGFARIKKFMTDELIPGFKAEGDAAITGALVGGPIGGGKTYICEAVAAELGVPVITLKNIRSKWYGETDQIFERLRRLLETFHKIVIFVDEADTMFGGVDSDHETERRLTGKIQGMMSDPALRGRVVWFLMTARVHRLSPDIRRPGRMDLIIPILDPEGSDRNEFFKWTFGKLIDEADDGSDWQSLVHHATIGYSSASFALLRSRLKVAKPATLKDAIKIAEDIVLPDIDDTREYQALQAKLNCTRRSLLCESSLPKDRFEDQRRGWKKRLDELERKGIR